MPPFLSDYDEDFFPDAYTPSTPTLQFEDQPHLPQSRTQRAISLPTQELESPPKHPPVALPKKRKRGGLLSGLDMNNIIELASDDKVMATAEDCLPAPAVAISSHRTRGPANGTRALQYDQKYHPLDEVLRPSQAAKRRAEHGVDTHEGSSSTDFQEQGDEKSDVDVDDEPHRKKCRKSDGSAIRGILRRPIRKVTRNDLYNIQVHPQDPQLAYVDADSEDAYEEDEVNSATTDANDDDVMNSITTGIATDKMEHLAISSSSPTVDNSDEAYHRDSSVAGEDENEHMIHDTDDNTSDFDDYYDLYSSPLPSPVIEQTPFEIYEEPLQDQPAKKVVLLGPKYWEHDDKENIAPGPAATQKIPDCTYPRTFLGSIEPAAVGEMDDVHGSYTNRNDYLDPSPMFGDANNRTRMPFKELQVIEIFESEEDLEAQEALEALEYEKILESEEARKAEGARKAEETLESEERLESKEARETQSVREPEDTLVSASVPESKAAPGSE